MVYFSLFWVAFGAATLLPFGSEALYIYDLQEGYSFVFLWLFASFGNTLGSMLNYWLGLKGEDYLERKNYLSVDTMQHAKKYFDRFGGATLLLAWVPIIGDPMTFIAGVLHYNFRWFIIIVFVAKSIRYAVIGFFYFKL